MERAERLESCSQCQCIVVTALLLRVYGVGTLTAHLALLHYGFQICSRRFF